MISKLMYLPGIFANNGFIRSYCSPQIVDIKLCYVVFTEECCDCDTECFDGSGNFDFTCPLRHKLVFGEHGVFCVGKSFLLGPFISDIQLNIIYKQYL